MLTINLPSVKDNKFLNELDGSSPEFKEIETLFLRSSSYGGAARSRRLEVQGIYKISNEDLWEEYSLSKKILSKRLGSENINERQLFHGTTSEATTKIIEDGFDWRVCGKNGTMYGKGSYFARDARLSLSYCRDGDIKNMFIAKVLTGKVVKGSSSMIREPEGYQCTVDNELNPRIFVIYHTKQTYPEYLIRFRSSRHYFRQKQVLKGVRKDIYNRIESELLRIIPVSRWGCWLSIKAKDIEKKLYLTAISNKEYADISTLSKRVRMQVKALGIEITETPNFAAAKTQGGIGDLEKILLGNDTDPRQSLQGSLPPIHSPFDDPLSTIQHNIPSFGDLVGEKRQTSSDTANFTSNKRQRFNLLKDDCGPRVCESFCGGYIQVSDPILLPTSTTMTNIIQDQFIYDQNIGDQDSLDVARKKNECSDDLYFDHFLSKDSKPNVWKVQLSQLAQVGLKDHKILIPLLERYCKHPDLACDSNLSEVFSRAKQKSDDDTNNLPCFDTTDAFRQIPQDKENYKEAEQPPKSESGKNNNQDTKERVQKDHSQMSFSPTDSDYEKLLHWICSDNF